MAAPGNSSVAEKYLDIKAVQDLIFFQSVNQSGQNTVFFLQETIKQILKDATEISKENVQLKASLAQQVTPPVSPKKEVKDVQTPTLDPFDQAALQAALNRATTSEDAARKNAVHLQKSQENEQALRARIDTLENENKFFKSTKLAAGLSSSVLSEHDCIQCQATFQDLIASGNTFIARIDQLEDALATCLKGKKPCAPTPPGIPAHVCTGLTDDDIEQLVNHISQNIDNAHILILRITQLERALRSAGVQVPGSPTLASNKRPRSDDGNGNDDDDAAKDCLPKLAKAEVQIADLTQSLSFAQAAFKQVSERVIIMHQALPNPDASVLGQPAQDTINPNELRRVIQRMDQMRTEMDRIIAEAENDDEDEDCKKKLEERDTEIARLRAIVTTLEAERDTLKKERDDTRANSTATQDLLTQAYLNRDEAIMDRNTANNTILRLQMEKTSVERDLKTAQDEITTLKQRLADAEYGTQDQVTIRELNAKIIGLQGEVRRLTRQLADCNARNGVGNQIDNDAATQDQNKIDDLEAKNTGLMGEVRYLTQQLADCNAGKANTDQAAIDVATQQIQARLEDCYATSRTLFTKHHATLRELETAKKTITTLQRELAECRSASDTGSSDQNLKNQLRAAQKDLKTLQKEYGDYKRSRKTFENKQREGEELEQNYIQAQNDLNDLRREKRDLTKKLADQTKVAEGHQDEVLIQIKRNHGLSAQNDKLQRLLAECNRARNILPPIVREQGTQTDQDNNADQGNDHDQGNDNDQGAQPEPAQDGDLQQQLDDCNNRVATAEDTVRVLTGRVADRDQRITRLEQESDFAATDLEDETERADEAEEDITTLTNQLQDEIDAHNYFENQLNDANTRITDLLAQILNLEGQVADLPGHVAVSQGSLTDCEEKVTQRDATIRDLNDQIKQLEIDIDLHLKLQKQLTERAEAAEAAKDCDEIVDKANARIKELYEETLSLKADIDFHIRSLQILNARADGDDQMQVDDNNDDDQPSNHPAVQAATDLAFTLSARLDDADAQIAALTATNEALTAQVATPGGAALDNAQALLALVDAARLTLDQTRQEVIALNIQITGLNDQVQTLTAERDALRARNVTEGRRPSGGINLIVNNGGSRPNSPTVPKPDSPKSEGPGSRSGSDNGNQGLADHIDDLEQQLKDCMDKDGNNEGLIDSLRADLNLARDEGRSLEEILDRVNNTIDELRQEVADEHNERWPARKTRQYKEAAAKRKTGGAVVKRKKREDPAVKQKRLWKENGWHKGRFGSPPASAAGSVSGSSSAGASRSSSSSGSS